MDLYIYYRVRSENAPALRQRAEIMQQSLASEFGVATGLKRRPEEKEGRQTWMEVYLAIPQGFEAALDNAVVHADMHTLIDGPRHTEHFMDIASCA